MIKSLNIQNYKLFNNLPIENIPQILLIGGRNNCGKTSFLEAVFLSLDCGNPGMFTRHLIWRNLGIVSMDLLFRSSFYNYNLNEPIKLEYTINSSKKKLEYRFLPTVPNVIPIHNGNIEIKKNPNHNLNGVEILYGNKKALLKQTQTLTQKLNELNLTLDLTQREELINYNEKIIGVFIASTNSGSPQENAKRYGELDKTNNTDWLLRALQIVEPKLRSLSVIPIGNTPIIFGDTGMGRKIPISLMGQGMERLTSILLAISHAKNGVALVDELENGFHHSVLTSVWEVITTHAKNNNTQVMATTHSMELISGAIEGIPENLRNDFKYIRIDRRENEFKIKNYNFESLSIALESEIEIR